MSGPRGAGAAAPVLYVHPHLELGGAERQTLMALARLRQRGWDVGLAVFRAKGALVGEVPRGVPLWDLGLENHLLAGVTALRLRRLINHVRPRIVVSKLWGSSLVCHLARALPGPAFVPLFTESLDPREHVAFIRLGRAKRLVMKRVYRARPLLVCNSAATMRGARAVYGDRLAYRVVTPGVELRAAAARGGPRWAPGGRPLLVSVGSLTGLKGHADLAAALARLGDLPWRWVIVGGGPEHARLRQLLDTLGILPRVSFAGPTLDPFPWLEQADLLLHGARSEGFGTALVEALSVGVPVIAADAAGPRDILAGGGGWLFARGDAAAAASTIRRALQDPASWPSPERCRQVAEAYGIERTIEALESVFLDVLAGRHG